MLNDGGHHPRRRACKALTDLDPSSAPGADGFTGAFHKRFSHEFALVIYDLIRPV